MSSSVWDERERQERERREGDAKVEFSKWYRFMGAHRFGHGVPAISRVLDAMHAIVGWRQVTNTGVGDPYNELAIVAVRVAADTLASEIVAGAADGQDDATVRWVAAGLRCPSRPFCAGCTSCQTVTSPHRPVVARREELF